MIKRKKWLKRISFFRIFIFITYIVLTQTHCVPPTNDVIIDGATPVKQNKKGLNYPSVIKTLSARLNNRFQVDQLELPQIYLTSSSIQQNQLSQLNQLIIIDLKQSLEKNGFIVEVPDVITKPVNSVLSECEARYAALNQPVEIILTSNLCDLHTDCQLIVLDILYQGKKSSETCHLTLTPDLVQKKNKMHHIPIQLGHIKKPYRNLEQSSKSIAETMHCMFSKLLDSQSSRRLLFAKTDQTKKSFVEEMMKQWVNILGQDMTAQTIIPINCYNDKFVVRDAKIFESIPDDIHLLIAMDSIEILPGKYRIRVHAMSLKEKLTLMFKQRSSVSFGTSLPGCQFQYYTYTASKGKSLTGEGSGKCDKKMPQHLWSYSAKTIAEQSAKQNLFKKVNYLLRKHSISKDLLYQEKILENKTEMMMNNAILEWEHFDDNTCQAEARFIIYDQFLPFTIPTETQPITRQDAAVSYSQSVQESLVQMSEPQPITIQDAALSYSQSVQAIPVQISEPLPITKQDAAPYSQFAQESPVQSSESLEMNRKSDVIVQAFKRTIHEHLAQDNISQKIIQMIEIEGFVALKESISVNSLDSKRFRNSYEYDLTFVIHNKKICLCKGIINGVGTSVDAAQNDCIAALSDLFYPFPLDMSLALDNKLSQEDLKQMLMSLDKNYFQLLERIDAIIELIDASKTLGAKLFRKIPTPNPNKIMPQSISRQIGISPRTVQKAAHYHADSQSHERLQRKMY